METKSKLEAKDATLEAVSIFRASDLDGVGPCRVWALCHSASHSGPGVREAGRGSQDQGFGRGSLLLDAQWNNLSQSLEAVHIPCFMVASL